MARLAVDEMPVTPAILDLILAGVGIEAILLSLWLRRCGLGRAIVPALLFLGSGALFLSALRVALANGGTAVVAGLLLASGLVHLLCLWRGYVAMIDRN